MKLNVTSGTIEYLDVEITDKLANPISNDAVKISLGTREAPSSTWYDAVTSAGSKPETLFAKLLLDNSFPLGTYYVWIKVYDVPEVIVREVGSVTLV